MNHTYPATCTTPEDRKRYRAAARKAIATSTTVPVIARIPSTTTVRPRISRQDPRTALELKVALVLDQPTPEQVKQAVAVIKSLDDTYTTWQQFRPNTNQEVIGISTRLSYAELQRLIHTSSVFNLGFGFENPHHGSDTGEKFRPDLA